MDLRTFQCVEVLVSDVHTGETRKHFPLSEGDVAVADRGDAHAQGMSEAVQQGADRIVRLNPFRVGLCAPAEQPLAAAWKRQHTETIRPLEVISQSACGPHTVRGWVHAYRVSAEQAGRARYTWRQRQKKGAPKAESRWLAGWGVVLTPRAPAVLSAQTILGLSRCRWQVEIAIKRWKSVLNGDALRAQATSPLAEVWLHGQRLSALMLERRRRRLLGDPWGW